MCWQLHIGPHTYHAVLLSVFLKCAQTSLHEMELVPVPPVPMIRPSSFLSRSPDGRHTIDCHRISIVESWFYHLFQCLFKAWLHHWRCFYEKGLVLKCWHVFVDIPQNVANPVPLVSLACVVQACRKSVLTSSSCHNIQKTRVLAFISLAVSLLLSLLTRRRMESGGRRSIMLRRP